MVVIRTARFFIMIYAIYPHSLFMLLVLFSEWAIISFLKIIKWFVFIIDDFVFCEVGIESMQAYIIFQLLKD
jgi:hypothetical protein